MSSLERLGCFQWINAILAPRWSVVPFLGQVHLDVQPWGVQHLPAELLQDITAGLLKLSSVIHRAPWCVGRSLHRAKAGDLSLERVNAAHAASTATWRTEHSSPTSQVSPQLPNHHLRWKGLKKIHWTCSFVVLYQTIPVQLPAAQDTSTSTTSISSGVLF